MELYLLRHGLAGQHGNPRYPDDSLRPLTPEGKKKIRQAAAGMKALGLKFDTLLSSPYLRARQTAEIVGQAYKKKVHLTDHLLSADIRPLFAGIQKNFASPSSVVLVGHEPYLSQMVSLLLKAKTVLPIDFKKGGLCCLDIDRPSSQPQARLSWFLTPKQLASFKK